MKKPIIPDNEQERLASLQEFSILDTKPEEEFDHLTFLASYICKTPISLVTFIDVDRQWFKSKVGLEINQTSRDVSFCAHSIDSSEDLFIVKDASKDDRFFDNPLVVGEPFIQFYAGVPIRCDQGNFLGNLCIIDREPRELDELQIKALKALANQVRELLIKRKQTARINRLNEELRKRNESLKNFSRIAAHDMKSPLNNIVILCQQTYDNIASGDQEKGLEFIKHIENTAIKMMKLIDGVLDYSQDEEILKVERHNINIREVLEEVISVVDPRGESEIMFHDKSEGVVFSNEIALKQIFLNILTNSIKYNDKPQAEVIISAEEEDQTLKITFRDNGPGIDESDIEELTTSHFNSNLWKKDLSSFGFGLATVKRLVEGLGGAISMKSEPGSGLSTTLVFDIPNA